MIRGWRSFRIRDRLRATLKTTHLRRWIKKSVAQRTLVRIAPDFFIRLASKHFLELLKDRLLMPINQKSKIIQSSYFVFGDAAFTHGTQDFINQAVF